MVAWYLFCSRGLFEVRVILTLDSIDIDAAYSMPFEWMIPLYVYGTGSRTQAVISYEMG